MLNGTLLAVMDGDGDVIARLDVDDLGGRPWWTVGGGTLLVPSGEPGYDQPFSRDGERQPRSSLLPTGPPLTEAPDGSGFLALRDDFILARYDAEGRHVDDLVLGINSGTAFDVAWSPAGDRYALAVVAPPNSPGFTTLMVSYLELRVRAAGEIGRDPYRAIAGHGFPVAGDEVSLVWSPDGSRLAMLNGTLLIVADEDGDVVARLEVVAVAGPPRWTPDGETLILPSGDSTDEQRFTRDGARLP